MHTRIIVIITIADLIRSIERDAAGVNLKNSPSTIILTKVTGGGGLVYIGPGMADIYISQRLGETLVANRAARTGKLRSSTEV